MRMRPPSQQELLALRQEFSVVARLERHKRKRVVNVALVAGGGVALAVLTAFFAPTRDYFSSGRGTGSDENQEFVPLTYDVPRTGASKQEDMEEPTAETGLGADASRRGAADARRTRRQRVAGDQQRAMASDQANLVDAPTVGATSGGAALDSVAARAARMRSLAEEADQFGKNETALGFDSGEAARKAEAAAAERKIASAADQGQKVAAAFASKLGQFKRCSTENQEKVRTIFTVTIHGRVVDPEITGTKDFQKRECLLGILRQAVFPAGDTAQTFSQTVTL